MSGRDASRCAQLLLAEPNRAQQSLAAPDVTSINNQVLPASAAGKLLPQQNDKSSRCTKGIFVFQCGIHWLVNKHHRIHFARTQTGSQAIVMFVSRTHSCGILAQPQSK